MDPESSTGSSTKSPQPAQESWPRMPQSLSTATASMRSMSISERAPPIGAKKGILKTPRTPQPTNPLIDRTVTPAESISQGGSVASSEATTVAASEKPRPMAWNSGKTASSLFPTPKEKQIVNPGDWGGYLVATKSSNDANQVEQPNMFRTQFWNITSKEYNVQQFWSELLNAYFCPFPSCADGTGKYSAASDIEAHIRLAHTMTCYRCPLCLKRFDRVAKLVGHVETSMKCRVKYSDQFDSVCDESVHFNMDVELLTRNRSSSTRSLEASSNRRTSASPRSIARRPLWSSMANKVAVSWRRSSRPSIPM